MSKKPNHQVKPDPQATALTSELIKRAWKVNGELLANDATTAAVVFLETLSNGTREPFSAIIYQIDLKGHRWIPGRPLAELKRDDSTNAEFQAIVRRAGGFPAAPVMTWPKA